MNGNEIGRSEVESALPESNSIAWDSDNPALIVQQVKSMIESTIPPDFDDVGDPIYATAGVLVIAAPDNVIYQGNTPDGRAAEVVSASGVFNADSSTVEYANGETISVNAPYSVGDIADGSSAMNQLTGETSSAFMSAANVAPFNLEVGRNTASCIVAYRSAVSFSSPDNFFITKKLPNTLSFLPFLQEDPLIYAFPRTHRPTGISRQVHSNPGYAGASGRVILPSGTNTNYVNLASTPSTVPGGKHFPSVADIYFGGEVVTPANATFPGQKDVPNFPIDLGLMLQLPTTPNLSKSLTQILSQWSPFITPHRAGSISLQLNGRQAPIANNVTYDVRCTGDIKMDINTPARSGVGAHMIYLHLAKPASSSVGGMITVRRVNGYSADGTPNYDPSVTFYNPEVTLVYGNVKGWTNKAFDQARPFEGSNQFILKRINSIAQTMNYPPKDPGRQEPHYKDIQGAPVANGPKNDPLPGFFMDGSFVGSRASSVMSWGLTGNTQEVYLIDSTGNPVDWTEKTTSRAGQYPFLKNNVNFTTHNRFYWENFIDLSTSGNANSLPIP